MRLFVAVLFPKEIRQMLLNTIHLLRTQSRSGNFSREENLHLTLSFLGEVQDSAGVCRALANIKASPFSVQLNGIGRFGNIWWAGVRPSNALSQLAEEVRTSLREAGYAPDPKPFLPHITLARELIPRDIITITVPPTTMLIRRISLMRSDRIAGHIMYTEIYSRTLK